MTGSGGSYDVGNQIDNDNENDGHHYDHVDVDSHGLADHDDDRVGEGGCRSTSFSNRKRAQHGHRTCFRQRLTIVIGVQKDLPFITQHATRHHQFCFLGG